MKKKYLENIDIIHLKVDKDKKIRQLVFKHRKKIFHTQLLKKENLKNLYNFFQSFNELEKSYFPYPLFKPIDINYINFVEKYDNYSKNEKNWTYQLLYKGKRLIGLSLIKKIGIKNNKHEKSKSPTSGIFIKRNYRKKNLGLILQNIILYQAKLMNLRKLYVRVSSSNKGSQKVYMKNGFKKTGNSFLTSNQSGKKWLDEEFVILL